MTEHDLILFYDIACPRRLRRVARVAEDHGVRLQKSFFAARLDDAGLESLIRGLKRVIRAGEDSIRIFRLCRKCASGLRFLGAAPEGPDASSWTVI